jgi:hypothetical protein
VLGVREWGVGNGVWLRLDFPIFPIPSIFPIPLVLPLSSFPMATPPLNSLTNTDSSPGYVITLERSDRWSIYHRLQELMIPCVCEPDGSLHVDVNSAIGALLVRSVVMQSTASRSELIQWLEQCWQLHS